MARSPLLPTILAIMFALTPGSVGNDPEGVDIAGLAPLQGGWGTLTPQAFRPLVTNTLPYMLSR